MPPPRVVRTAFLVVLLTGLLPATAPELHASEERRPRLVAQLGHGGGMVDAALSPDGRWLATAGMEGDAILWEAGTGCELRRFRGHGDRLECLAWSPDGKRLLTGGGDGAIVVWDPATGEQLRRLSCPSSSALVIRWCPDGRRLLVGGTKRAWIQDPETGEVLHRFELGDYTAMSMAFDHRADSVDASPDSRRVVVAARSNIRMFDAETGEELSRFTAPDADGEYGVRIGATAFSRDGKAVFGGVSDGTARMWDRATGAELRRFSAPGRTRLILALSPGGTDLLTGGGDGPVRLWSVENGAEKWSVAPELGEIRRVGFSHDGRRVLIAALRGAILLDAASGEELRRIGSGGPSMGVLRLSRDGRWLAVLGRHWTGRVWDLRRGSPVAELRTAPRQAWAVEFSPESDRIVWGSENGKVTIRDLRTGEAEATFSDRNSAITGIAFLEGGKRLFTGSLHGYGRLWDLESGEMVRALDAPPTAVFSTWVFSADGRIAFLHGMNDSHLVDLGSGVVHQNFPRDAGNVSAAALGPDGERLLTGSPQGRLEIWDTKTGDRVHMLAEYGSRATDVAFSPDGRLAATASWEPEAVLWDAAAGTELRKLLGHSATIESVTFSPNGEHVFTSSWDGTARIWRAEDGREICCLIEFDDGSFAVVDPEGRYDASSGGDVEGLHWVIENEAVSLDQLKERYYEPGLLAKHLGLNDEPLREVGAFTSPGLFPEVELLPPKGESARLGIRLRNRGGGIGRVVVRINGKERTADARGPGLDPDAESASLSLDLAGDPRLVPGEKNVIEVLAYNGAGHLRSRGLMLDYTAPGVAAREVPELWAVIAGTSDYLGDAIDLRYAAKDAEDFATALRLAGNRLFGEERVHIEVLTTSGTRRPTRGNLLAALEAVRGARPGDILVLYLSGHGVSRGGEDGDFHYLTADARSADLGDPEVRARVAIASRELTEIVKALPPLKQVLILDTCASGRLVDELTEKRSVPGSQVRALERLKDRTGLFVLAGCASDRVSYEATRYAQGLLTHSLLMGMKGAALRDDEYVDVATLFGFAADMVPQLAMDIGGVQRPILASPRAGASFDIGRMAERDRERVPLQAMRPMFLRSVLQEAEEFGDPLGLAKQVDALLSDASSRGAEAPLVFVDAREFPDAYRIAGQYSQENGRVTVRFRLFRGSVKGEPVSVEGDAQNVGGLARAVVEGARGLVD